MEQLAEPNVAEDEFIVFQEILKTHLLELHERVCDAYLRSCVKAPRSSVTFSSSKSDREPDDGAHASPEARSANKDSDVAENTKTERRRWQPKVRSQREKENTSLDVAADMPSQETSTSKAAAPRLSQGTVDDVEGFRLRSLWKEELQMPQMTWTDSGRNKFFSDARSITSAASFDLEALNDTQCEKYSQKRCGRLAIHPNSKARLTWDLLGMMLIGYDIVMLPLQSFSLPGSTMQDVLAHLSRFFWSMDMPSCFLVGYHLGGALVMNPAKIAKRYIRGWFPMDLFLVTLEWAIVLAPEEEDDEGTSGLESLGLARVGKGVRVLRVLRILRLLRLMKLPRYFVKIEERIQSASVRVMIGIAQLTVLILTLNHFIACIWWAIGVADGIEKPGTWVTNFDLNNADVPLRYTVSLHWTLTQFTPAAMEVYPQNLRERVFSIVVLIFAMITFSSFISSITNAMTALRNMNSENARKLLLFQQYLRQHGISTSLAVRMRRHLEHKLLRERENVEEKDVELMSRLSKPLQSELHLEVHRPHLVQHPFFEAYNQANSAAFRKICHTAIDESWLSHGDVLFSSGENAEKMYIIKCGVLNYTPQDADKDNKMLVQADEWISEAALWAPWVHVGVAMAPVRCCLLVVDAMAVVQVARGTRSPAFRPGEYADLFVNYLNSLESDELSDLHSCGFDMHGAVEVCSQEEFPDSRKLDKITKDTEAENENGSASSGLHNQEMESHCTKCRNEYMNDANFCRKCGHPRGKVQVCVCGNRLLFDAAFCRKCGAPRAGHVLQGPLPLSSELQAHATINGGTNSPSKDSSASDLVGLPLDDKFRL